MLISELQERLRRMLSERIAAGELTGTELAVRAGFQQAHISNFLNQRRGLSVEAMDRVMEAMRIGVADLLPKELRTRAARETWEGFDSVPVVQPAALLQSDLVSGEILEFLKFKKSFLRRIRPEMANHRENWTRFVLVRADKDSAAMRPRLQPGAMLLVDRHYNSLNCYRRREPNIYVVMTSEGWKVRYAELQGDHLTLRPENLDFALGYVPIAKGNTFADYVVGRVAHVSCEI